VRRSLQDANGFLVRFLEAVLSDATCTCTYMLANPRRARSAGSSFWIEQKIRSKSNAVAVSSNPQRFLEAKKSRVKNVRNRSLEGMDSPDYGEGGNTGRVCPCGIGRLVRLGKQLGFLVTGTSLNNLSWHAGRRGT
jgi:hypothetical protein